MALLEGLEVGEINLSDVRFDNPNLRIDSEYFKKQYLKFFENVENLATLGSFVAEGYRVIYENTQVVDKLEATQKNYPVFLQAADLKTPFINTDDLFHVHENDWIRYPKGRVKHGELLIEVKGKIEKVALVPDDFPEKALVTGSLYKMSVNEKINKHYLLTYLICKYGVAFKERYKTNLLISFISKDDLYRIPVPQLSTAFQTKIEDLFKKLFADEKNAIDTYRKAETLLLETLGMADFTPSTDAVNIKSFKDSFAVSGRLDAEYYQLKYEDFERHVLHSQWNHTTVEAQFDLIKESSKREKQQYQYIEIGDINVSDGKANSNFVETIELPANAKIEAKRGDVLVSKVRPNRGAIAIIDFDDSDLIVSGAFTVLRAKSNGIISAETLKVLLRTKMYRDWLLKFNVGTSYPVIRDDDVLGLPIPIVDSDTQQQIADLVQHSFALKAQSTHLLEVAKRAVEVAIEQDEAAALAYITREGQHGD